MCARPSSAMLDPLRSIFPRESEFCVGRFARADPLPPVPWRPDPGGLIWILHFLHLQPGVGGGVRKLVDLSQDRTPSHPDAAELRPCHPNHATTTALNERRSCGQERCLKLLAVKHEVVRRLELLRRRWR